MGKSVLGELPMRKAFLRSAALTVVTIILIMTAAFGSVYADPEAVVDSTNPWESGGQITLTLKNCDGYNKITVVADFGGTVTDASGWGFDTYKVDGSKVTAEVTRGGQNDWAFNGSVGIQVNGSNINEIKLVSITGDSTSGTISTATPAPTAAPASSGDPVVTGSAENKEGKKGDDWLTTKGSKIVDQNGTEVWLTGVNWFGYNTGTNIFDGCWSCSMDGALKAIADRGFNLLRIPISAELLLNWRSGTYPNANFNQSTNSELSGMNSLEILDYALARCETYGIKVMFDIHSAETDASGHNAPLWYTDKISTEDYLTALDWLSARYKDNDTVIAYDLKNEPHGAGNEQNRAIWNDSKDPNNWPYVAALAGNTILDNNPHALIVIEGNQIFPKDIKSNNFTSMNEGDYYNAWWGGNLMGVKDYPVDLGSPERNKQIVYSPHDYGPAVYQQPWFDSGFSYQSLMDDYWYDYWFYIKDQDIAPILIGEWGGFMSGDNLTWMTYLRQLIGENNLNYTFWCFNANSGDTGGLVKDDFTTWDEEKYAFVSEVLWKTSDGKPIGLDHEIALGNNGVSLGTISGSVDPIAPTDTPEPSEETDETEVSTEDTKVSDETTVAVSVETESEEEEVSDEVSTKKADNNLQLSALGNILKVVAVIAILIVVALVVFIVTRVIVLKRKGQSFKEILVNIFKLF